MSKVRYAHVLHCAQQKHKSTVNISIIPTFTNPRHRTRRARRPYDIHPPVSIALFDPHQTPSLAPRRAVAVTVTTPRAPRRARLSTTYPLAPHPPREVDRDGTARRRHPSHRPPRTTLAAAARDRIASPRPARARDAATRRHRIATRKETTKKKRASPRRRHRTSARVDAPSPSAEPIGPLANGVRATPRDGPRVARGRSTDTCIL